MLASGELGKAVVVTIVVTVVLAIHHLAFSQPYQLDVLVNTCHVVHQLAGCIAVAHFHAQVLIFSKSAIESCLLFQLFISEDVIDFTWAGTVGSVSVKLCKALSAFHKLVCTALARSVLGIQPLGLAYLPFQFVISVLCMFFAALAQNTGSVSVNDCRAVSAFHSEVCTVLAKSVFGIHQLGFE